MDVVAWLRGLGLERYASAFRDNDIDRGSAAGADVRRPDQYRRDLGRSPAKADRRNRFSRRHTARRYCDGPTSRFPGGCQCRTPAADSHVW